MKIKSQQCHEDAKYERKLLLYGRMSVVRYTCYANHFILCIRIYIGIAVNTPPNGDTRYACRCMCARVCVYLYETYLNANIAD